MFKAFLFALMLLLTMANNVAFARNIGAEQRAASSARDDYNQAKSDAANNLQSISAQEKRVADEQAHLKQLQDTQTVVDTRLEKAKADLAFKEKALETAWEERNK
ncbi:MAG: hypothetical protein H7Z20_07005 [Bdellovibrio sp.]|nr:hypothetical protein [Methylotenera sp.]